MAVLSIFIMLYITSLELLYLITESVYLLTTSIQYPLPTRRALTLEGAQ